jgi:two-component system, NarL family, nitrate/nitrite response regulator NarL
MKRMKLEPGPPMKRITVLLAEDHMVVREGLRKLLEAEDDLEVVGEAETGRQALEMTRRLRPAVVVMDIAMPLLNGLEATRQILKQVPGVKILILSAHSDEAYVEKALEFGAKGFLLKQTSAHVLSRAIREVQRGNVFFTPSIAKRFGGGEPLAPSGSAKRKAAQLSSREVEALQLIAEGKANKQIADELGISVKTVEKHRQRLMQKLGIHDTAGLTRYAIAAGVIESSLQTTFID